MSRGQKGVYNLPILTGSQNPNGLIFGSVGQLYIRNTGQLWMKTSGNNTTTTWTQFVASSTQSIVISAADFTGNDYANSALVGLTAMVNFNVFSLGSGSLLTDAIGYTFDDATGTLTMTPDDYLIEIY